MKTLLNILMLLFSFTAVSLLFLYFFQSKLIYSAPSTPIDGSLPSHVSKVELELSDSFLLMPESPENETVPLMIFAHGNAELAHYWFYEFDPLLQEGVAVLLVEYPGYGGSTEPTNIKTIRKTMIEAFDVASNFPSIDSSKIFAYGRSIGGGAVALLAESRPLSALGLESTFSSLPKLVSEKGLPSFLLSERYDNKRVVETLEIPIFLYHGTDDRIIPFTHAESLAKVGNSITFHHERCGHNNCPRKWEELLSFLELHGLK